MKILMITPYLPYPIVSGGQIRTYNLLKNLSTSHEITLLSFIRENAEKKHLPELEKFCKKVLTFNRTSKAWHPRNIIKAGFTPYPFVVALYHYPQVKQLIEEELENHAYDLIHAETFYVMPNIPETKIPILLVEQVIEYLVYQRYTEMLPMSKAFVKPLLYIDVAKIKYWERYYWKYSQGLAAMSHEDKDFMLDLEPGLNIDVIANGVDIEHFATTRKKPRKQPTVLFIGNFKWLPNRDAAAFLVNEIWPLVKKQVKDAQLLIVGRTPTKEITALGKRKDVIVDGGVEDIRMAYAQADVLLAPIRNGRGTKYKILEAMATKTPIVGTELAVDGVNIKHNTHALVGETSEKLADYTAQILLNKTIGQKLANKAFTLVQSDYSWKKIAKELDDVYLRIGKK